ncbi:hypothetical protein BDN70DRAFT_880631 [Pholiota conissans]|uniref:F-box domain-containing protein n=1 Tax=Pholiota conissans TaxID=109636 RepID=A0A9P5YYE6_9AGAR|nr:hypothetical protein BDN70DRAFT_880631 [Pholiota conissans]
MPLSFTGLPDDILIQICIRLDPKDLISVIQTCRVLHAFAFSDYVWHHIHHILPVDLSSSRDGHLSSLSASEIQAATIRALNLDVNWRRPVSRIKRMDKIQPSATAVIMQPLGPNWLVTSNRTRGGIVDISVWRLGSHSKENGRLIPSSRVIHIKPEKAFTFCAAFQKEGGDVAIITVLGAVEGGATVTKRGHLTIYQVNLKGHETNESSLGIPYIMQTWRIQRNAILYYAQISGPVVAAAFVPSKATGEPRRLQILLANIQTKTTVAINSPGLSLFDITKMRFKLYSPYIVITGIHKRRIIAYVRKLPNTIFSSKQIQMDDESLPENWAASIVDYETGPMLSSLADIHISPEPIYATPLTTFTLLVTYSPYASAEGGKVEVYRFPVDTSALNLKFSDWRSSLDFLTPANVTLEPMCLGKTGLRAVWLSHQWNTDDFKLMKASFPNAVNAEAVVAPFHAPTLALPFEPHTCHSLYFDEAAGKVWVGVHTGDIFVFQF